MPSTKATIFLLASCFIYFAAGQTRETTDYVPSGLKTGVVGLASSPYTVVAVTKSGKVLQWGGVTPQPPAKLGSVKAAAVAGMDVIAVLKNNKVVSWGMLTNSKTLKVPSGLRVKAEVRQMEAGEDGNGAGYGALILGTDKSVTGLGYCSKIPRDVQKKATVVGVNKGCYALVGKTLYSFQSGASTQKASGSFSNFWATSGYFMFAQYSNGTYVAFNSGSFAVSRLLKELKGQKIVSMSMTDNGAYLAVTSDGRVLTQSVYNPDPKTFDLAPKALQGKGTTKVVSTYTYSAVLRKGGVAGSGPLTVSA